MSQRVEASAAPSGVGSGGPSPPAPPPPQSQPPPQAYYSPVHAGVSAPVGGGYYAGPFDRSGPYGGGGGPSEQPETASEAISMEVSTS
jgi:hypothetical protein